MYHVYLSIPQLMDSWLVSAVWFYEGCCYGYPRKSFSVDVCFHFSWVYRSGISESYGNSVSLFEELPDSFTILHSYQQFMRFLIFPHPCEHLLALKNKKMYLFIYFWLFWVFAAAHAFLQLRRAGGLPYSCKCMASRCGGFPCCVLGLWRARASGAERVRSLVVVHGL